MIPTFPALRARLRMRHLQLLQALGEKGSLRAAADVIGMSQPAATKALQELEGLVGATLFTRHPRGLMPTLFGEAMTRYANTAIEDLRALRHELAAVERGEIGRVRIGAITAAAPGLLTQVILAVRARHPQLDLSVQVNTSDVLIEGLNQGTLDLVIGRIPVGWPAEHLSFSPLSAERLMVVARAGHRATQGGEAELDALRACAWVLQPEPSPMRRLIDGVFSGWGDFSPAAVIETSSTLTTLTLVRDSDMIGVMPYVVGRYLLDMGALAEVPLRIHARLPPYGLITRQNREATPAMQRVAAIVGDAARAIAAAHDEASIVTD